MDLYMGKYLFLLVVSLALFTTRSFSQKRGAIKGSLTDTTAGKSPLQNATVSVTPLGGDSTQTEFTVSDKSGAFSIKGIKTGQYRLLITYEGYQPINKRFSITDSGNIVDFGNLFM